MRPLETTPPTHSRLSMAGPVVTSLLPSERSIMSMLAPIT